MKNIRHNPFIPKLSQVLVDGFELETRYGAATIELRFIGELNCVSGRLVACDPWLVGLAEPLVHTITIGRYPVYVSIAKHSTDQRIIVATVRFEELQPESWKAAVTRTAWFYRSEHRAEVTQIVGSYAYPVQSKNDCFLDWNTASAMVESEIDELDWNRQISQLQKLNYEPTRSWANLLVESERQLNAIAFSSGIGDGSYGTYWGIYNNEIVALTTDFGVLSDSDLNGAPDHVAEWFANFS